MAPKKNTNAASAAATPEVATPPPSAAPVVEAPPAEAPVETPSAEAPVEAAAPSTLAEESSALIKTLESFQVIIKNLSIQVKQAIKDATQTQKKVAQLEKATGRRNKGRAAKAAASAAEGGAPANRKPSGFATPAMLSKELSDFLGVPEGTKLARTEVTRRITEYVKANSLFDQADKRNIRTDDKLKQILGGDSDKPLTYFNLQSFIKHHFLKPEAAAVAPAPVATA